MKHSHSQAAGDPLSESRNTARLCVENPHLTWVLLIGTVIWGIYGYTHMPQRKDPDIPMKVALVETPWPGASAEKVEQLVTKTVEKVIASNNKISKIESTSRSNSSVIIFSINDDLKDVSTVLDDIGGRLAAIRNLPDGAGPIRYQRDFGDTAALMLTVASPRAGAAEIAVRATRIREAIQSTRSRTAALAARDRASLVFCFPQRENHRLIRLGAIQFVDFLRGADATLDPLLLDGAGCVGADVHTSRTDDQILKMFGTFVRERYPKSQWEPDVWSPFVVRNPNEVEPKLASVAGEKYGCVAKTQ